MDEDIVGLLAIAIVVLLLVVGIGSCVKHTKTQQLDACKAALAAGNNDVAKEICKISGSI